MCKKWDPFEPRNDLGLFLTCWPLQAELQTNQTCSNKGRSSLWRWLQLYHLQGWNALSICPCNKPFIFQKKRREPPTQFSEMSTRGACLPGIISQGRDTGLPAFPTAVHSHQHAAKFSSLLGCWGCSLCSGWSHSSSTSHLTHRAQTLTGHDPALSTAPAHWRPDDPKVCVVPTHVCPTPSSLAAGDQRSRTF